MSNSAALSVHRAISSASVVGSMRAAMSVAQTISVRTNAYSVTMIQSCAVQGTLSYLYVHGSY